MNDDLRLHWPRPAATWNEAAPVGNGRLGAMVFGGTRSARLQINDSTLWSGTPDTPADGLAAVRSEGAGPARLAEIRDAIRAGDLRRAESLLMSFEGRYSQEYLPFADLTLGLGVSDAAHYGGRTLDLDDGVAEEEITDGALSVVRRTWASRPAEALCVDLTVTGGTLDATLDLTTPLRILHHESGPEGLVVEAALPVDGAPEHEKSVKEPLRYADRPEDAAAADAAVRSGGYDPYAVLVVRVATDGRVTAADGNWAVTGMTRLLVTVASSSAAADVWHRAAPVTRAEHRARAAGAAERALALGADALLRGHQEDLRPLLAAARVTFGARRTGTYDVAGDILSGKDEQLTATVMFQLGRYLLASCSRPGGGPPANLQGMWNEDLRPAWSSNYTVNINTEMNYWPAEVTGLGDCHEPLFGLLDRLAETGADVARELYGTRGWVTHHNTDMWGWSLPVGMGHSDPSWALWMMGGAWLTQHLWDHYDFTRDTAFLRERAWPVLRGQAAFCVDWLVEGEDGFLDTIPATSPENHFLSPAGEPEALTHSTTMDIALVRATLTRTLAAARIIGVEDDPLCAEIEAALPRLREPGTAAEGHLLEWVTDLPEQDPLHRHMSQLVTLYPLDQITPRSTPELAEAARLLMERRGPGAMGWSWAWKIALRARLGDGDTARSLFLEAVRPLEHNANEYAPVDGSVWGGLLPNLFSTHPPFQMDGNFGFPAGLAELVVQSHGDLVDLLPALPAAWGEGRATGLRCRGGLAADLAWEDGALTTVTLRRVGGDDSVPVRVGYGAARAEVTVPAGRDVTLDAALRPAC
ncbi:glycosyl hydrolase family 95 catalytic domain-containing protein [Streptomyces sp. NBC_01497]|uniref:glycosyl hydrolase family 95 catalytic domain-containing protein n=1 Tax=Streptomyces sp. NBC_01497 TaxID=2903885 RepID=UPI002E31E097|nr:glycoside hydrolase N-terminal domain-containing protein [Streptomyces sp. NBC_01497]